LTIVAGNYRLRDPEHFAERGDNDPMKKVSPVEFIRWYILM